MKLSTMLAWATGSLTTVTLLSTVGWTVTGLAAEKYPGVSQYATVSAQVRQLESSIQNEWLAAEAVLKSYGISSGSVQGYCAVAPQAGLCGEMAELQQLKQERAGLEALAEADRPIYESFVTASKFFSVGTVMSAIVTGISIMGYTYLTNGFTFQKAPGKQQEHLV